MSGFFYRFAASKFPLYKSFTRCYIKGWIAFETTAKFFAELAGVAEPESKRKIIGKGFIDVFDVEAHKIKDVKWLAQGTICLLYTSIEEIFLYGEIFHNLRGKLHEIPIYIGST